MRFQGTIINPNTGEEEEIDTEAYDETPEIDLKPNDDGSFSLIGPSNENYNPHPENKFYVGETKLSDGTIIDLTSTDMPDGVELIDETANEDDDY